MQRCWRVLWVAAATAFVAPVTAGAEAFDPVVTIDSGKIAGVVSDDVASFKGIPFAAPPLAGLRWRPPQPVARWSDVRPAEAYGQDCIQVPVPGDAAPLGSTLSEDCLYLNVWRPAEKNAGKLPVMVWIHGGGYVNGGSSAAIFDGSAFARQGIVLVSINYRLGRFGFFAHPALTASPDRPLANYGYMDQIAALQWVNRNIGAFGGDPGQVTIFGESAGGGSVLDLVASHAGKGLFHRAIALSGGGRQFLGGLKLDEETPLGPSAEEIGVSFARGVGIRDAGADGLAALRALPAEKILGKLNMIALLADEILPFMALRYVKGPVIDGTLVKGLPANMLSADGATAVPLIIGATGADLGVQFPPSRAKLFTSFGPYAAEAEALYDPEGTVEFKVLRAEVGADRTMQEPARFIARQVTKAGHPAWVYRFDYIAESERAKATGAGHASELPFLFDTLDARFGDKVTEKDRAMAKAFNTYFANFAKGGDPNGAGLPDWPKVDPSRSDIMMLSRDDGPVFAADPWAARLDLLDKVAADVP
jgi:para-nitrobenzyl esterase